MKEINKEEFKKEIEDYVKVLFRKTIKEADQQQLFQAVSYAVKDFIEQYPYLFKRVENRISLLHDSLNTYLRGIGKRYPERMKFVNKIVKDSHY